MPEPPTAGESPQQAIARLERRVRELEVENSGLRERLAAALSSRSTAACDRESAVASSGAGIGAGAGACVAAGVGRAPKRTRSAIDLLHTSNVATATPPGLHVLAQPSSAERPFVVLVAGEHWQLTTGQRMMGSNHCSLSPVGQAYGLLVDKIGRENISTSRATRGSQVVCSPTVHAL